eukprot:CAMPEP_0204343756 /NCGR_PEP_ID=MMETSP0469-20131031/25129_1 /ASSEMBLY_ACC=CAM_ASM_000384 /TAXON_ID=2969 /ORGANISM="Oxyrrhis marina" /LENGTH=142 /DNA_ID=CAMNT_0051328903 /DNA_START=293 /DNA_END=722 /DNA_ORIENTATION=-
MRAVQENVLCEAQGSGGAPLCRRRSPIWGTTEACTESSASSEVTALTPKSGAAPAAAVIGRTQVDDEELAMRLQQEEIARAQGAIADDDLVVGQPVVSNESAGRPLVGARSKMAERANRAKKAVKSMFSCLPSSSRAQSSQR